MLTDGSHVRTLRILRRLLAGWATITELAAEHATSRKTIYRDVAMIRLAGFRVVESVGARGAKSYTVMIQ